MVLLFCLIFLTALTLLGLSASAEAILQNRLTTNLQQTERAKQSALTAMSFAEDWLLTLEGPAPEICSTSCPGLRLHSKESLLANPEFQDLSWWQVQGHEAGIDPVSGERIEPLSGDTNIPSYWIIQTAHEIPPAESETSELQVWYRIIARGSGRTNASVSVIESMVVRSWASIEAIESSEVDIRCPGVVSTAMCERVSWRELR